MMLLSKSVVGIEIRAMVPAPSASSPPDFQAWFNDHQSFRFSTAQKLISRLAASKISPDEWYELFDALLLEGHTNAAWLGRSLSAGELLEISDADFIYGRGIKDADADYLLGFLDDIAGGRYGEMGDLSTAQIENRVKLYINKMRGTVNSSWLDSSGPSDEWYWRLGGNEEHCTSCPELAAMSEDVPFLTSDLPTVPGAGGTECLTNCLCHLERVANGVSTLGVMPFAL